MATMPDTPAVVRIAPSPTGDPHVGTGYIALFNHAMAHRTGGRFILRIEDTDRTRYNEKSEGYISESLNWLGLPYQEGPDVGGPNGPYRQSERTEIYREYCNKLLESGWAYRCFCTPERLKELRENQRSRKEPPGYDGRCRTLTEEEIASRLEQGIPYTIRLRVPKDRTIRFDDQLRGPVEIEGKTIDDQVLLKSDGYPTYHLANVVDDHLMEVTDVIRAEEWITSTPKHVLLYEAFGWEAPRFWHMPLLRNKDRSKISKRKNPTNLLWYRENGYLPEALRNFLGLMGYSLPSGEEVFSLDTMLETFDPGRLSTTGPVFDLEKLTWLNGEWIRSLDTDALTNRLIDHFAYRREVGVDVVEPGESDFLAWAEAQGGLTVADTRAFVHRTVPIIQERIKTLQEYALLTRCFWIGDTPTIDEADLVPKKKDLASTKQVLGTVHERLAALTSWDAATIEATLRGLVEELGWKARELFQPVRVASTGGKISPPLFESLELLGQERSLARLASAAA